jgi:ribosomal protein L37E
MMTQLMIQVQDDATHDFCALCGKRTYLAEGPQLFMAENSETVCRDCGKKHAPSLASLLDLAGTAQRVGRIGRHTLTPPLHALLDLARAAENYLHTSPQRCRQAV